MNTQKTRKYLGVSLATSIALFTAGTSVAAASGSVVAACQQATGATTQARCINVAIDRYMRGVRAAGKNSDRTGTQGRGYNFNKQEPSAVKKEFDAQ